MDRLACHYKRRELCHHIMRDLIGRGSLIAHGVGPFFIDGGWVKMPLSFTSRVYAGCPSIRAARASNAERTMGTCVLSISMYSTGTGWLKISGNSRCTTPLTWRSTA